MLFDFIKKTSLVVATTVIVGFSFTASASLIEPDYNPEKALALMPWYEVYGQHNFDADMRFINGMRPHHAGALTMSQDYLESTQKSSERLTALATGIIRNQTFEILMLDKVEQQINAIDFGENDRVESRIVAKQGWAQQERFARSPIPSLFGQGDIVSAEDVRFAKAMIVHHEGALTMCDAYLNDPASNNGYLELMCLDILRDQTQEIELMHDIIAGYPGNPNDIKIDPSMVHGMDGMMHSMNHTDMKHQHH